MSRLLAYLFASCFIVSGVGISAQEVVNPAPLSVPPTTPAPELPPLPQPPEAPPAPPSAPVTTVPVLFHSDPQGATVQLDGQHLCTTPCRVPVEPGLHHVTMRLENHREKSEEVSLAADSSVSFDLEEKPYNYFLMNDLENFGTVLTTAIDPTDTRYRLITVIDGAHFFSLASAIDLGMGGNVFSFHRSPRGEAWSIFGFGPSVRLGRIIATAHIEILSFRHDAPSPALEGWRPGLTSRLQLPLLGTREARGWASLLPVPTVGVDVWADRHLAHDETAFWVGLAWLPGTDF